MLLDEYNIPLYERIADLNRKHGVFLVRNIENGKIYVEKFLTVYNREVYDYLLNNPIKGTPRIIKLYEKGGVLILIEEYITGTTLSELLENGRRFSENETISITKQLCEILEKLHKASPPIINRDIKPSNIILNEDGFVKLVDMNSSKWENPDEFQDTMLIGTEGYAAPEQYGFGSSDRRTDIYSLGILMNQLLTGEFPSTNAATGYLSEIIKKCIHLDPLDRYQSIKELSSALKKAPKKSPFPHFLLIAIIALCIIFGILLYKNTNRGDAVHHISELPANVMGLCSDDTLLCRSGESFVLSESETVYAILNGKILADYEWNSFGNGKVEKKGDGGLVLTPETIGETTVVISFGNQNGVFRWTNTAHRDNEGLELYLPDDLKVVKPGEHIDFGGGSSEADVLYHGVKITDFDAEYSGEGFFERSADGILHLSPCGIGTMTITVRYNGEEAEFFWQANDKIKELDDGYESNSLLLVNKNDGKVYSSGDIIECDGQAAFELQHKRIRLENYEITVHGYSGTVRADNGTMYWQAISPGESIVEIRYGDKVAYFHWNTKI